MPLDATSLAAGVGNLIVNVQFLATGSILPRKVLIIGTYDPAKTAVVDDVPVRILSAEDAGDQFGFGFMIHRLAVQAFRGSLGIEAWVIPQTETSAASTGTITFTPTGVLAGTVNMYIAGIPVPFDVAAGDTGEEIVDKAVIAIAANTSLPVTAVKDGVTPEELDFTSKSEGLWGDGISLKFNLNVGEVNPTGLAIAITTPMGSGAGTPDISTALDGLGTGDNSNASFFTDVVHGYGQVTTTLDAIEAYVGAGNTGIGLYKNTIARPFRALTGDVAAGSAGLTALNAITDVRRQDRANGAIAAPGSPNHASEHAALAIGIMARVNNNRAEESYVGQIMTQMFPGIDTEDWTTEYDNRDLAVKNGISPTKNNNGVLVLQNVVSFYRPANVPVDSNLFRSMRNISITQNILFNIGLTFSQAKWQGISIVEDKNNVTDSNSKAKARDIGSVREELVALAGAFAGRAWLFNSSFTVAGLREPGAISIRSGSNGFDSTFKVIYSGEGGIINNVTKADTSIAILNA